MGGFCDLRGDLCSGEVCQTGRSVSVVNSSHHVCWHPMLKPRASIAGLSPYHSIVSRAGLSLDLNESMAGCSPRVLARLRSLSAAEGSLYPQREGGERLVANFLRGATEQGVLTNGMHEARSL